MKSHPLAGKRVRIKLNHLTDLGINGELFIVEDWWLKLSGKSWRRFPTNPACLLYSARVLRGNLPKNDNVVYGKIKDVGYLIHESELGEEVNETVKDKVETESVSPETMQEPHRD